MSAAVGTSAGGAAEPIVFDTSALLCRYISDRRSSFVDRLVATAPIAVITSLTATELAMGLHHAIDQAPRFAAATRELRARTAADLERFWVVPVSVEGRDGVRATELAATYGLNLSNALHLSALERLPRPASLVTFDDRQVAAAIDLGFDIVDDPTTERVAGGATAHGLLAPPTTDHHR